jgi:hypothetical protein
LNVSFVVGGGDTGSDGGRTPLSSVVDEGGSSSEPYTMVSVAKRIVRDVKKLLVR